MKKFCPVCGIERDTEVIEKEEVSNIRGDEIRTISRIRICSVCKEELFDEDLDEENIKRAYNLYRERHGILSPEEIKSIRERYGLSQRAFAKLLNIGEASIARYETGALPEKSLSNMIMLLKDPQNMQKLLEKNGDVLTYREKNRLLQKLSRIMEEDTKAVKIPGELYKMLEEKARKEGKSTDELVEEILKKVV
ncbi:MAG: hypothetical protein PWP45_1953 [Tepidanaerobacteraceae bacterium]|nr:hypothetical protein [Tepidanaerobacteraceae bacterium]